MSKPLSDKESSEPNKDATTEHDETVEPEKRFEPERPTTIPYGPSGIRGLFGSKYVLGAALLASLGGFSMGYDMGVISIINTMDEFHAIFPYVQTEFGKGLMTAMLLLGAFVGCLFMSYLADRISRKWALTVVVIVFDIGGILQTAAQNYAMLIVGRFIGGIGVGTLAMVLPLLLFTSVYYSHHRNPFSLCSLLTVKGSTDLYLRDCSSRASRNPTSSRVHLNQLRTCYFILYYIWNAAYEREYNVPTTIRTANGFSHVVGPRNPFLPVLTPMASPSEPPRGVSSLPMQVARSARIR